VAGAFLPPTIRDEWVSCSNYMNENKIQIDRVEIRVPIRVDRVDVGLKAIPRLRLIEDGSLRLSTYGLRFLR